MEALLNSECCTFSLVKLLKFCSLKSRWPFYASYYIRKSTVASFCKLKYRSIKSGVCKTLSCNHLLFIYKLRRISLAWSSTFGGACTNVQIKSVQPKDRKFSSST